MHPVPPPPLDDIVTGERLQEIADLWSTFVRTRMVLMRPPRLHRDLNDAVAALPPRVAG